MNIIIDGAMAKVLKKTSFGLGLSLGGAGKSKFGIRKVQRSPQR
jgi:hypothetical protein